MSTSTRTRQFTLGSTLDFMRVLWAVHHGLQSSSKRMDRRFGVTGPQRLVVRIIGQLPGASAGELASALQLHPSTLTGVLRRLETRGLIERRTDASDKRRALFHLTKAGAELDTLQDGTPEEAVARALASVASADVAATRRVLSRVAAALAESVPPRVGGAGGAGAATVDGDASGEGCGLRSA